MSTPLPLILQRHPFTIAQAAELGVGRGRLHGPAFQALHRGVFASAGLPLTLALRVEGALLVLPSDAIVTGVTGLHLWGVTIGSPNPLTFASTSSVDTRRAGIRVARVRHLPPGKERRASPAACFSSAVSSLDLPDAVAAGDWLVRLGLITASSLLASTAAHRGRGCRLARAAAALVRSRVDSPRETRLRLCLVLAGLPEPVCNLRIGGAERAIARVDLALPECGVVLEYEGDHHRTGRAQWEHDVRRYEDLTAAGFVVIRVTSRRFRNPREVVSTTYKRLVEGGYAGPPPRFDGAWQEHFEPSAHFDRQIPQREPT